MLKMRIGNKKVSEIFGILELYCYLCIVQLRTRDHLLYEVQFICKTSEGSGIPLSKTRWRTRHLVQPRHRTDSSSSPSRFARSSNRTSEISRKKVTRALSPGNPERGRGLQSTDEVNVVSFYLNIHLIIYGRDSESIDNRGARQGEEQLLLLLYAKRGRLLLWRLWKHGTRGDGRLQGEPARGKGNGGRERQDVS